MKLSHTTFFILVALLLASCTKDTTKSTAATEASSEKPVATPAPDADGFISLNSLDMWRNFKSEGINPQWKLEDGVLSLTGKKGGDIITKEQYQDFELELEWKISKDGNSGIFFHVAEADSLDKVYHSGPEIQVLDNDGHPDGKIRMHRAGDNYDLQACTEETVKAVGEWNQFRLIVNKGHVEHWLNGTKVVEYQLQSPEWEEQYQKSKFTKWPAYGRAGKGHIALQDHGNEVWFKNIRVKAL